MHVVRKFFGFPRRDRAYSAFFVLPILCLIANAAPAKERRAAVTVDVKLNAPPGAQTVRLWVPYPVSDSNQDITAVSVSGDFTSSGVYREGVFGNAVLYAEWNGAKVPRTLTCTFTATRRGSLQPSTGTAP